MIDNDRLDDSSKIHQESTQDGKFMRADGNYGIEADTNAVIEVFLSAIFVGHQANVNHGRFPLERV